MRGAPQRGLAMAMADELGDLRIDGRTTGSTASRLLKEAPSRLTEGGLPDPKSRLFRVSPNLRTKYPRLWSSERMVASL
jgi:hypothetical protein